MSQTPCSGQAGNCACAGSGSCQCAPSSSNRDLGSAGWQWQHSSTGLWLYIVHNFVMFFGVGSRYLLCQKFLHLKFGRPGSTVLLSLHHPRDPAGATALRAWQQSAYIYIYIHIHTYIHICAAFAGPPPPHKACRRFARCSWLLKQVKKRFKRFSEGILRMVVMA